MSLHARGPVSENVIPDDETDTVAVYGQRVSGELLRALSEPTPEGKWFRIVKIDGGISTFEMRILPNESRAIH